MALNSKNALTSLQYSSPLIPASVIIQNQLSKTHKILYSKTSSSFPNNNGPIIKTNKKRSNLPNLHKTLQPWNASLPDKLRLDNHTRCASEGSTNSALLSPTNVDLEFQYPNNNTDMVQQGLSDDNFENQRHGNKSSTLSRNCYGDIKVPLHILSFLVLCAVTAAVGTCLVLLLIDTSRTKTSDSNSNQSNASALANENGSHSISGNRKGVNPNPMNFPVLMDTTQSSTKTVVVRTKLLKSTVAAELATTRKTTEMLESSTRQNLVLGTHKKLSYFIIKSIHDFEELKANPHINAITIDKLIDTISDNKGVLNSYSRENTKNVKHLNVAGSITEDWLISLLNKFNRVENLTISIDGLCVESTVEDPDSLEAITLENVQHLMIESSHLCKIITWVFKWKLPKIQQLRIHNSDLTRSTFEPIHTFLEVNKKTLTSVIVSNSFICSTCSFTKEENNNVRNITFLNEMKNPYLYS